ncbi:MAG: isoprenylcysteine carboxylmethyltransferase family protein [Deltaproteobacteria bacterium]|nr:isoprenylcysteine carboxylmethyltransferase family protein [Deltaproteobacteria bacterium]
MTLKTKWIDILYNAATGSRRVRNFFTPIGAIFYGLLIFVFVIIALYLDRLLGLTDIFPGKLNIILSLPVFLVAFILIGWSVQNFLKVKGTPVPFNPPPQLVTSGPYAYTRNPMLTGVFALLFGFGVLFGSVSLLVVFTPIFILINVWELKAIEEPELLKRLGQDFILNIDKVPPCFFQALGNVRGENSNSCDMIMEMGDPI